MNVFVAKRSYVLFFFVFHLFECTFGCAPCKSDWAGNLTTATITLPASRCDFYKNTVPISLLAVNPSTVWEHYELFWDMAVKESVSQCSAIPQPLRPWCASQCDYIRERIAPGFRFLFSCESMSSTNTTACQQFSRRVLPRMVASYNNATGEYKYAIPSSCSQCDVPWASTLLTTREDRSFNPDFASPSCYAINSASYAFLGSKNYSCVQKVARIMYGLLQMQNNLVELTGCPAPSAGSSENIWCWDQCQEIRDCLLIPDFLNCKSIAAPSQSTYCLRVVPEEPPLPANFNPDFQRWQWGASMNTFAMTKMPRILGQSDNWFSDYSDVSFGQEVTRSLSFGELRFVLDAAGISFPDLQVPAVFPVMRDDFLNVPEGFRITDPGEWRMRQNMRSDVPVSSHYWVVNPANSFSRTEVVQHPSMFAHNIVFCVLVLVGGSLLLFFRGKSEILAIRSPTLIIMQMIALCLSAWVISALSVFQYRTPCIIYILQGSGFIWFASIQFVRSAKLWIEWRYHQTRAMNAARQKKISIPTSPPASSNNNNNSNTPVSIETKQTLLFVSTPRSQKIHRSPVSPDQKATSPTAAAQFKDIVPDVQGEQLDNEYRLLLQSEERETQKHDRGKVAEFHQYTQKDIFLVIGNAVVLIPYMVMVLVQILSIPEYYRSPSIDFGTAMTIPWRNMVPVRDKLNQIMVQKNITRLYSLLPPLILDTFGDWDKIDVCGVWQLSIGIKIVMPITMSLLYVFPIMYMMYKAQDVRDRFGMGLEMWLSSFALMIFCILGTLAFLITEQLYTIEIQVAGSSYPVGFSELITVLLGWLLFCISIVFPLMLALYDHWQRRDLEDTLDAHRPVEAVEPLSVNIHSQVHQKSTTNVIELMNPSAPSSFVDTDEKKETEEIKQQQQQQKNYRDPSFDKFNRDQKQEIPGQLRSVFVRKVAGQSSSIGELKKKEGNEFILVERLVKMKGKGWNTSPGVRELGKNGYFLLQLIRQCPFIRKPLYDCMVKRFSSEYSSFIDNYIDWEDAAENREKLQRSRYMIARFILNDSQDQLNISPQLLNQIKSFFGFVQPFPTKEEAQESSFTFRNAIIPTPQEVEIYTKKRLEIEFSVIMSGPTIGVRRELLKNEWSPVLAAVLGIVYTNCWGHLPWDA